MKRTLKIALACVLVIGMLAGMVAFADGSPTTESVPDIRDVEIADVSAGTYHNLALDSDGHVWTWGNNNYGQLGIGTVGNSSEYTFMRVLDLDNVVSISAGANHNVAVKADGTAWVWGYNRDGNLGVGDNVDRYAPTRVEGLTGVRKAVASLQNTYFLMESGVVFACGNNTSGQVGNGNMGPQARSPVQVKNLISVVDVDSYGPFCVALRSNGTVWTWGDNAFGKLGLGSVTKQDAPVQVTSLSNIEQIAVGNSHFLALKSDGTVWMSGRNHEGQLDISTRSDIWTPVQKTGIEDVINIYAGTYSSFVQTSDNSLLGWGRNSSGQMGVPEFSGNIGSIGIEQIPIENVKTLAVSDYYHCIVLLEDGSVWGWGYNGSMGALSPLLDRGNIYEPVLIFSGISPVDPPDPTKCTVTVIERFLDGSPDITNTYDVAGGDPFAGTYASTGTIKSFNVSAADAEVHADFEDRTLSIAKVDRYITITLVFGESGTVDPPGQNEIAVLTVDNLTSTINQGSNTITFNVPVQDLTNGRIEGDITDLWAGSDTIVFIIADGTEHPRQLGDLVYINDGDQVYVTNDKIYTIIINVVGDPQSSPYGAASAPDDEAAPASEASHEPPPASEPEEAEIPEPEPETEPDPEE